MLLQRQNPTIGIRAACSPLLSVSSTFSIFVEDDDRQVLGFVAIPIVHIVEQICCDSRVAQAQAQAHASIGISIKHAIICSCKSAKNV